MILDCFDLLISKIKFKKKIKNIILIYFQLKIILKNNNYDNHKQFRIILPHYITTMPLNMKLII
jgi:hypothetical protein